MYKDELLALGFSEKEALIFLTLLRVGPSPASTLARLSNIKRTSMYDILNTLTDKNVIGNFKQGGTQYFYVDDLNKIVYSAKEKLDTAKTLIHELKNRPNLNAGISVHYYKGVEGFNEMYNEILEINPKELLGWMNLNLFYTMIDPKHEDEWTARRIKQGIKVRLILQESKLTQDFQKLDKRSNRETRFVPGKFPFSTSCLMYSNYVTFFNPGKEVIVVRIYNEELFQMQKQIFEMNWDYLGANAA